MIKILVTFFVLTCLINPLDAQKCICHGPEPGATTRTRYFDEVSVVEKKPYKILHGVAHLAVSDEPTEDVLVELFTHPKNKSEEARRIAACLTEADGRYCFSGLRKGNYELRGSREGGFEITHVYVTVDPLSTESTEKEINLVIYLGK